ncbi:MAG: DUF2164 family protein [Vallitaleaceae bacterium]|nr:DUF2164 family protein [Vallitaleaceae bacterium]
MSKEKLALSKEATDGAIKEIQHYFLKERDEDLGLLSATLILEFFIEKLGPAFYNQGLQDAMRFITEKAEDIYSLEK